MRWAVVLSLLLLIPAVAGQINGPQEFTADYGFTDATSDSFITIVSGALHGEIEARQETWGFLKTDGMRIDGVDVVCHQKVATSFDDPCIYGDFTLRVDDGSGLGMKWPTGVGDWRADHALGFLATSDAGDLNALILNETLVAPSVGGTMTFTDARAPNPMFLTGAKRVAAMANAAPLFADSRVTVVENGVTVVSFGRSDGVFGFAGSNIEVPEFRADTAILPFTPNSRIHFSVPAAEAAQEGISMQRIQDVQSLITSASASGGSSSEPAKESPVVDALSEVLDAALVRFPIGSNATAEEIQQEIAVVLFDTMDIQRAGNGLLWTGQAAFQYQGGEVQGAQSLSGFWYIQLPWWGWGLWVIAIGVFIARAVVKPAKRNERWDRYRWVGWLAGTAMFLLVFFLWDLEMRAVWGTSVLSTNTDGTAFWVTLGLQLATQTLVLGAIAWPVSIIIKNTLLLSKQGTFMGLGKPTSLLLTYLLGATLFLSYMQLLIASVIENLGG